MERKLSEYHKRQIAAAMRPLREGVALKRVLSEIESATRQFWQELDAEARFVDVEDETLRPIVRPASVGRPRRDSMRTFIRALVTIYERATGRQIRRQVDRLASQRRIDGKIPQGEKFHPFLLICTHAASSRYSRLIVKTVLHDLHPNQKPGRPKRTET